MRAVFLLSLLLLSQGVGAGPAPDHLYFKLSPFKGDAYSVNLQPNKILVQRFPGGSVFEETGGEWCAGALLDGAFESIVSRLEAAGAFEWDHEYRREGMRDGVYFRFVAYLDGDLHTTRGSNEFPDGFSDLEFIFHEAIENSGCGATS